MNLFSRLRAGMPDEPTTFIQRPDGSVLTYGDLLERTGRLANVLRSWGVQPGDRVAAQVDKSVEALLVYLGAVRAGAVYLPLNPAYTSGEIRYFLNDAAPSLFICRPHDLDAARTIAAELGVPRVETLGTAGDGSLIAPWGEASPVVEDEPRSGDDIAAILYTSGTTGRSKGAMLTHDNLASNSETLREIWRVSSDDVLLHALPIFHTHGLFVATNTILAAGASMIFLPAFDAGEIIRLLPSASLMMGVPTFYTRLLAREDFTREVASGVRLFISGSAPLSPETHREFRERAGHAILERYGMTETNMNSSNPYDGERVPGSVGLPLPDVEIRIADPATGRPPPDGIGVIEVRGPNVFKGYWQMPEKTKAEFRDDGFFITGDLGHFDERGYLYIVGRGKDLIITGGLNVYPAEVEAAIEALPGVQECAVIGVPHPDFGESVVAVIARKPGAELNEEEITNALSGELARFKQPKRLVFCDELPRNAMGKVQKADLRSRYSDLFQAATVR
jgi:malonyl-CoA/methylmalonyl-CoA synthetase